MGSVLDFDDAIIAKKLQQLVVKLCQLPCFEQLKADKVRVIEAGLSQACFYVKYDQKAYFAKYLNVNSIEPLASQIAARHGISPTLIYVEQNWLVTEFIAGQVLDTSPQSDDDKLTITLALLARCHRIPHDSFSKHYKSNHQNLVPEIKSAALSVERAPRKLAEQAIAQTCMPIMALPKLDISATIRQLFQHLEFSDSQMQVLGQLLSALEQNLANTLLEVQDIKQVFCHGDANFSNVILPEDITTKPEKIAHQLIDFECACIAPAEYDLAMLIAVNELDISKVASIYARYQQELKYVNLQLIQQDAQQEKLSRIVDNPMSIIKLRDSNTHLLVTRYYDLCLLINGLWYFLQFQRRKVVKYKTLALKQMMLLALRHPQTNNVIDEMR